MVKHVRRDGAVSTRAKRPLVLLFIAALCLGFLAPTATAGAATAPPCPTSDASSFAFKAVLDNGSMKIGSLASSTGNRVDVCGLIGINADGSLTTNVKPENTQFTGGAIKILFLSIPASLTPAGPVTGGGGFNADGSLSASFTAPIQANVSLLGFSCTLGPLAPTLTTGASGKMTGQNLVPVDGTNDAKGKLVANAFSIPAIKSTRTCPFFVSGLVNVGLGLPLAAGKSSVAFDITLTLT